MATVPRYDYYSLRPMTRLPHTGFLLCEGVAAKEGVLRYVTADGTIRRELVTREDTLTASSLSTLPLVKFTDEHPDEKVTPSNTTTFGRGTVLDEVECHNGFVKVRFVVDHADTIAKIEAGELPELSPGYDVTLDETPGVHPVFGEYDAIQKERIYNHLAGTKAARGGHDVRFRTDAAGAAWQIRDDADAPQAPPTTERKIMAKITLDGLELDGLDTSTAAAINAWRKDQEEEVEEARTDLDKAKELLDAHRDEITNLEAQIAELVAERDNLAGQLEGVLAGSPAEPENTDEIEIDLDPNKEPEGLTNTDAFLKWHRARNEMEAVATRFNVDSAQLDNPSLRRAICEAHLGKDLKGRSNAVVEGIYEGLLTVLGTRDDSYSQTPARRTAPTSVPRTDGSAAAREAAANRSYLDQLTKRSR